MMQTDIYSGYGSLMPEKVWASANSARVQPINHQPQHNTQHSQFVVSWHKSVQPRLTQLLMHLGVHQHIAKSLALAQVGCCGASMNCSCACAPTPPLTAQVWTYLPVLTQNKQMLQAEQVCLLGDQRLQSFHSICCQEGVNLTHLGPMSHVWESGVVQVVQDAANLSVETHPCNRLQKAAGIVNEIIYIPVYDAQPHSLTPGVVAALEIMVASRSSDAMVVANIISSTSEIMECLQLSLSNPKIEKMAAPVHASSGTKVDPCPMQRDLCGSMHSTGTMLRTPSVRVLTSMHTTH